MIMTIFFGDPERFDLSAVPKIMDGEEIVVIKCSPKNIKKIVLKRLKRVLRMQRKIYFTQDDFISLFNQTIPTKANRGKCLFWELLQERKIILADIRPIDLYELP